MRSGVFKLLHRQPPCRDGATLPRHSNRDIMSGPLQSRKQVAWPWMPPCGPPRGGELAEQALRALPTGGRTPLAHALVSAHEMLASARQAHPEQALLLVVLSDGRANVPLPEGGDPWDQSLQAATQLADAGTPAL